MAAVTPPACLLLAAYAPRLLLSSFVEISVQPGIPLYCSGRGHSRAASSGVGELGPSQPVKV